MDAGEDRAMLHAWQRALILRHPRGARASISRLSSSAKRSTSLLPRQSSLTTPEKPSAWAVASISSSRDRMALNLQSPG